MFETSARLLRLLGLLHSRRDWTGGQLAERLGVSSRTVRTDVERLRSLGYVVDAVPGVGGGYRLGVGTAVPPLLLDDEEAVAVVVGLRSAASTAVEGIEEASVRALAKLELVLPSRLRRRVAVLGSATVALPSPTSGAPVDPESLLAVAAACRDHERLRFAYVTRGGESSRRLVEPHRLVSAGRRWYLLAHDVDRGDWRTFRIDRMRLRLPAGPRFTPRDLPDAEVAERISTGLATAAWAYRARVTVQASAEHVAARLPWMAPIERVDDSTCRLELGSDSAEQLAAYLGMLGADFAFDEQASPELAACVRDLVRRYADAVCR
ncbi:YafY family protein [Intrasporangium sp.]|uniref:helix-turn-helix transcriptional regulator n=1 Tax=Intrasporangium sp. TaxID=1925024 RepID=UPI002939F7E3|nr:YafY family protein [Intrasporangium sp.]MDV3222260.1 YafY family transcriptional regulator [Intrasporangium sp.]